MGLRTGDLGFVTTPGIAQSLDECGALGLQVEGMLGDFPFLVGRAHLGVGPDHIGHQGDARRIGRRLGRIGIGLGRFDAALQGAEQVELIRRTDADIANVGHRHLFRKQERLTGFLQALGAHLHPTAPAARCLGRVDLSTRSQQAGGRYAQISVGGQGLLYQLVEPRIMIQAPPVGGHRRRNHRFAVHRQFALQVFTVDRGFVRQVIIRTDHLTRRQQQA
ncbi:hypothetical protein D3C76_1144800 [compost metagenome]